MSEYKVVTQDYVNVQISTSKDDISFNEKRFQKGISVIDLKQKLELLTGGSSETMKLELFDKENKMICPLSDDNALFGSYPVEDGMRLHVVDKFSLRNELEFENVEKYEMPTELYAKKQDTVRAYLMRNKLGKYHDDELKKRELAEKEKEEEKNMAEAMILGSRCQVTLPGAARRLGAVRYAGKVDGLNGYWVGIQYDEPLGKNNGSVNGQKYFECPQNYGSFVKPQYVVCGDFPEEEYDLDEEI